jgi:glutamine amidotransferase
MNKVAIIDYGMGNLHSVAKAMEFVGKEIGEEIEISVTFDPQLITAADRVIFPGVGAIRDCMSEIKRLNIGKILEDAIRIKPVLAICVGMQALMEFSEENEGVDCLGFMKGQVTRFEKGLQDHDGKRLKVPHMGWSKVKQIKDHPLWKNVPDNSRFYFVHSYYVRAADDINITGTTRYGSEIISCLAGNNVFATQFHPEKSQTVGLTLLRNFLKWDGKVSC